MAKKSPMSLAQAKAIAEQKAFAEKANESQILELALEWRNSVASLNTIDALEARLETNRGRHGDLWYPSRRVASLARKLYNA